MILKGFVTKTSRYFPYLSNKLCCWEVRHAITSPFCTPFYNSNWNLNETPQNNTTQHQMPVYLGILSAIATGKNVVSIFYTTINYNMLDYNR